LRLKHAEPKARHYYDRRMAIVRDRQKKKENIMAGSKAQTTY
jgi:hypothetical protein